MQYKIGRLLGNKPKELALSAITEKLVDGDIIILNSDIIDNVSIRAAVTIDGQGHSIYVEPGNGGLNLYNHCKIINCNFVVGEKANGINVRLEEIELSLENCTFRHENVENGYTSIYMESPLSQMICDNVIIDYAILNTRNLKATKLHLGHPEFSQSRIQVYENKTRTATNMVVENFETVNTYMAVTGNISKLTALEVMVATRGEKITIDSFLMDINLDIDQQIQLNVITGLKIVGNVTIKEVLTPEINEELAKRYKEKAKLFSVSPKNNGAIINISGDWTIANHWVNTIYSGNVNFTNYKDVNEWYFKSEDAKITWKNSSFRYKKDYVPRPKVPKKKTAQEKLDEMIGLVDVKKKVKTYIATNIVNKKRKELGQTVIESSLHLIFGGAAGTGKTQVARLLTQILFDNGIISKPSPKEVTAKDMIGEYTGQTSPKTHELILEAKGGVLFIDEAYELDPSNNDGSAGYKREALTTLVKDMDDYRSDLIVIMAGYSEEMKQLLQANSGLPSRFVNKIIFPNYSDDELIKILNLQLKQQNQNLDEEGYQLLNQFIKKSKKESNIDGNGRWVRNLLQFISQARDVRIVGNGTAEIDPKALNLITAVDVREGIKNFK